MNESSTTARRQQFERWARNAAALIEANPREYKLRVALLAALGYVVVFGLLAVLVGLIGGSIWAGLTSVGFLVLLIKKKLIVVLGMLVYSLVKALWVKLDPPTGYALSHARFPELHREVETLQHELLTPRIHEILLTDQFNASVQQTPRLGIFGWPKNSLILGLPLLLALAPDQARAVLAHEFGHMRFLSSSKLAFEPMPSANRSKELYPTHNSPTPALRRVAIHGSTECSSPHIFAGAR